jgi:hypothetical protein
MNKRPLKVTLHKDDVLFFQHIPKTAGLSLISILDAQFKAGDIFPLHSAPSPDTFDMFSPEQLATYRLVRGHYRFGPYDQEIYRYIARNPICISFLRNPIERTISAYRHIFRKPENKLHEEFVSQNISLKEFVCNPKYYGRSVNVQTRRIVGSVQGNYRLKHLADTDALSDEAFLELAKERLEQFAFVGLTERFQESVQLLTYIFDWKPINDIPVLNTAPIPSSRDSITQDTLVVIMERTQLDAELYRYAEQLFEAKWTQMQAELNTQPNKTKVESLDPQALSGTNSL